MLRTADKRLWLGKDLGCLPPKHHPIVYSGIAAQGVAAHSSTNTKGTYVQLTASTAIDADGFYLYILRGSVVADYLIDVATGASLSEVDFLSNYLCTSGNTIYESADEVYIPLGIAAGQRVAVRCQSTDSSAACTIAMTLVKGGIYRQLRKRRATTYGAATGDSGGVSLDPGAVGNTYPATYTQISAAITNPIERMLVCIGGQNNAARASADHALEIATGASSSEVIAFPELLLRQSTNEQVIPNAFLRDCAIPAGVRLSARQKSSITDATDRLFDIVVIGFD